MPLQSAFSPASGPDGGQTLWLSHRKDSPPADVSEEFVIKERQS